MIGSIGQGGGIFTRSEPAPKPKSQPEPEPEAKKSSDPKSSSQPAPEAQKPAETQPSSRPQAASQAESSTKARDLRAPVEASAPRTDPAKAGDGDAAARAEADKVRASLSQEGLIASIKAGGQSGAAELMKSSAKAAYAAEAKRIEPPAPESDPAPSRQPVDMEA